MAAKKRKYVLVIAVALAAIIVVLCMIQLIALNSIEKNIEKRASNEIMNNADDWAADINHSLLLQFNTLESLSRYLGDMDNPPLSEVHDLMTSFLAVNKFCALAYTDIEGNILGAVSADNAVPSGNVSDRQYFKKAIYWKDSRAIQYMNKTALTDDPRILYAVPIVNNNMVKGCLFASTEQDFFEEKIFGEKPDHIINSFLIDEDGNIIADYANKGKFQNGFNIYESYLTKEEVQRIQKDMADSGNGLLKRKGKNPVYLAYAKTDIDGWTIVSQIDFKTAQEKYEQNMMTVRKTMILNTGIFAALLLCSAGILLYIARREKARIAKLEDTERKLRNFLEKSGSAVFEYDASSGNLHVSSSLEEMFGRSIPANWFSVISERKKMYSEFDYDGIIRIYNETITTGEHRELNTCIKDDNGNIKRLKFSMTPLINRYGKNSGVTGIVTDISNTHSEEEYAQDGALEKDYSNAKVYGSLQKNDEESKVSVNADNAETYDRPKVFIHAFGYFEVYADGRPVSFNHDKSKEMLAVLVDRKGGFVSSSEMITYLWEDEPFDKKTQARCRQVASRLKKILEENGIEHIMETVNGRRRIVPENVDCDYLNYLQNKPGTEDLFTGAYMLNYSWSELTAASLENSKARFR